MKILQLCNKPPFPPIEGGPIAMNIITQALIKDGHVVKVLAVNSYKYFVDDKILPDDYKAKTNFEAVFVDLKIKYWNAFINLFSHKSYHVERFISKDFSNKIKQILKEQSFDIIQIETIFLAPYIDLIRKYSRAKIILRAHNIEHLIWKRLAANTSNIIKKKYINHLATTLKNYELKSINNFDGVITISKTDCKYFIKKGCSVPIINIPFGIDNEIIDNNKVNNLHSDIPTLFYIGSMNWLPNQEGINWFIDNVWNEILQKNSKIKFNIAGRCMPNSFTQLNIPNINIIGEVDDAYQYISENSIMIVPLFSGSGIRIKIIEGMMLGKPVITTTIGAEGINYRDGHDIIIANTAQEFVDSIIKLFENPDMCKIIGQNARELILVDHNMKYITPKLIEFYQSLDN